MKALYIHPQIELTFSCIYRALSFKKIINLCLEIFASSLAYSSTLRGKNKSGHLFIFHTHSYSLGF